MSQTNLSPARVRFFGRRAELDTLGAWMAEGERLVTILGPPGAGKSRLARRFGMGLEGFEGGVWRCVLQAGDGPERITSRLAATLGLPGAERDHLERALANRGPTALLIDNAEHMAPQLDDLVGRWLDAAPDLVCLLTSRVRLGLLGEVCVEIAGLSPEDAAAFFEHRWRALGGRGQGDPALIEAIAARLDHLPLAMEIVAGCARVMPLASLARRLDEGLPLTRQGTRAIDAALGWSWAHLEEAERAVLGQCALFEGSFTLEAAEAILQPPEGAPEVFELIEGLRDQSLLAIEDRPGDPDAGRLKTFSVVAAYCAERTPPPRDNKALTERHTQWFAARARELCGRAFGPEATAALAHLQAETLDMLAAATRALDTRPDLSAEILLALAPLLDRHIDVPGFGAHLDDTLSRLGAHPPKAAGLWLLKAQSLEKRGDNPGALDALRQADAHSPSDDIQARIEVAQGRILHLTGHTRQAREHLRRAVDMARPGLLETEAEALGLLAATSVFLGDLDEARSLTEAALSTLDRAGDARATANALSYHAAVCAAAGLPGESRDCLDRALAHYTAINDQEGVAIARLFLGQAALGRGDLDEALDALSEALAIQQRLGLDNAAGTAMRSLGALHHERGDLDLAEARLAQALRVRGGVDRRGEALDRLYAAFVAFDQHKRALAIERLEATIALAEAIEDMRILGTARTALFGALKTTDPDRAQAEIQSARQALAQCHDVECRALAQMLASTQSTETHSYVVRCVRRFFAEATSTPALTIVPDLCDLRVEPEGRWFQCQDEPPIDMGGRHTHRRILAALLQHRLETPGEGLSPEDILAAGWPGERVLPHAARNRVYVAIRMLRKAGLEGLLLTREGRYLLDPDRRVQAA